MDAAVFTLFSNLIKNWQDSRRFSYLQAYKMYDKFRVGSVTTRVSAKAYEHLGDRHVASASTAGGVEGALGYLCVVCAVQ